MPLTASQYRRCGTRAASVMMASQRKHRPVPPNASRGTHPAAKNVRAIAELERTALHERSAADRVGDAIAHTTGSAPFAVVHLAWFGSWVLLNTGRFPGITPFDPYPFSFLTLVVSLEAIFLSVFVLMSQNRMTRHAEKRAHLDLQVNLLAEQELTALLELQRAVCHKLGIDITTLSEDARRLMEETDVHRLAATLERKLPSHAEPQ
jgi:uncharacterized membrane protein